MPYVDEYGRVIGDDWQQPAPPTPQQQAAEAQRLFALRKLYPEPTADQSTLSGYVNRPNALAPRQATLNDRETMDPVNPIDRARNWVTDSDWYRGLNPDAQRTITGGMDLAEYPAAPLRAAYDAGTSLAKSEYGSAALDAASALPLAKGAHLAALAGPKLAALPAAARVRAATLKAAVDAEKAAAPAIAAPAIHTGGEVSPATIQQIQRTAAAGGDEPWPTATQPVFKTDPASLERTYTTVPQRSVAAELPKFEPGEKMPLGQRALPIEENKQAIADAITARLAGPISQGDRLQHFYGTYPIIEGLEQHAGLSPAESIGHMRQWSGFGAATSPQTKTPRNLRNASYVNYRYGSGDPIPTKAEGWTPAMNEPGFPMMGGHADLARKFYEGTVDPWRNPKPYTFREAWSGNVADNVADTHNVRATLLELEKLYPGQIPRGFFTPRGYELYQQGGLMTPVQALDKKGNPKGRAIPLLHTEEMPVAPAQTTVGGRTKTSEFTTVSEPWRIAARQLGVSPSQAQSLGWFHYGGETGLASPPKIIPDLLNDQVEATAKALGVPPEWVVKQWGRKKIPLAQAPQAGPQTAVG